MKYRRILICSILLIIILMVGYILFMPKVAETSYQSISGYFYEQPRIPYHPYIYVLGTLVDCLSFYESGHNPNAIGKAGEIGCLQFMPSTFQMYCVEKYGLTDIWDCEIQRECADRMLKDGGINNWTTKDLCI